MIELTLERASLFASTTLGHISQEFPHKPDHLMQKTGDYHRPSSIHPVFYGSYDWHSCVHAHWQLARLARAFPDLPQSASIWAHFDAHFTTSNLAVERDYIRDPANQSFERPYGWSWLLKLAHELSLGTTEPARRHHERLLPLAQEIEQRFVAWLPRLTYPVRVGTHGSSAFALSMIHGYASAPGSARLRQEAESAVTRWFGNDRDIQVWEPSGEDFLSPSLMEADCVRRWRSGSGFAAWLARFLPRIEQMEPAVLFEPAFVSDRSDARIVHLDGLNLSRAWCMRSLAGCPDVSPAVSQVLRQSADAHLQTALKNVVGKYVGTHWLASFALLALLVE